MTEPIEQLLAELPDPELPAPIPLWKDCLCPDCDHPTARGSEMCDPCAYRGCDHVRSLHALR